MVFRFLKKTETWKNFRDPHFRKGALEAFNTFMVAISCGVAIIALTSFLESDKTPKESLEQRILVLSKSLMDAIKLISQIEKEIEGRQKLGNV